MHGNKARDSGGQGLGNYQDINLIVFMQSSECQKYSTLEQVSLHPGTLAPHPRNYTDVGLIPTLYVARSGVARVTGSRGQRNRILVPTPCPLVIRH